MFTKESDNTDIMESVENEFGKLDGIADEIFCCSCPESMESAPVIVEDELSSNPSSPSLV